MSLCVKYEGTLRVALSQQDNDQVIRYAVLKNVNTHTQKKRK